MTRADVTALSGDPLATMDEAEWAEDMINRMSTMTFDQAFRLWNAMTDDEQEMILTHGRISS